MEGHKMEPVLNVKMKIVQYVRMQQREDAKNARNNFIKIMGNVIHVLRAVKYA
jgi:hypothetical protein